MTARSPVTLQIQTGQFSSLEGRVSREASHLVTDLLKVLIVVIVMAVAVSPSRSALSDLVPKLVLFLPLKSAFWPPQKKAIKSDFHFFSLSHKAKNYWHFLKYGIF